jgi:hypothetical protein
MLFSASSHKHSLAILPNEDLDFVGLYTINSICSKQLGGIDATKQYFAAQNLFLQPLYTP